ncbi:MAG: alpha-L-fucosidase [Opitutaceae bacterium]
MKEAGLRGLVLTAKHHDGFCLWPSRYTEHSIAHSPYRGGKGDIVREVAEACRRQGIQFGLYLSPWDRNRADYGQPSYIAYYRAQLTELLTSYGPLFEIWFDGANGGDGFYGGARETRAIDGATYYDWPNTWKIVRELQPQAAIFSDAGPDARWVGNEKGVAGDPCWATINAAGFYPGHAERLETGDRFGAQWIPAEVDVSIRPGWFFHPHEQPKTPAELFSIYLTSVGRGANLILNLAPDRRGRVPEADVASLRTWHAAIEAMLAKNLAAGATLKASNVRAATPPTTRRSCSMATTRLTGRPTMRCVPRSSCSSSARSGPSTSSCCASRSPSVSGSIVPRWTRGTRRPATGRRSPRRRASARGVFSRCR